MDANRTRDLESRDRESPMREADTIAPATKETSISKQYDEIKSGPVVGTTGEKKKAEFEEILVEVAPPPPYSGSAFTAEEKKTSWRTRRILLLALAL